MNTQSDGDARFALDRIKLEIITFLRDGQDSPHIGLHVGKLLVWISGNLDNGDATRPVYHLGEAYRKAALARMEVAATSQDKTAQLRRALETALKNL